MESDKENEEIKYLLLPIFGNNGVGKSFFFRKIFDSDLGAQLIQSIGLDMRSYEPFSFKIIDTSGTYSCMDALKNTTNAKLLYIAKLYILMYDASVNNSYEAKTFTTWIDFLQKQKKKYNVSKNKNYFFLLGRVDEDKEKYKIGEIGEIGDIGNVLKDLNTMYKKTAPGYVFINLGTIDIMKGSPEKILFQIDEYVKDNNLRQTIYDKQKKYLNKIWSKKEKEAGNYYCSII
jgi:hypothetical protein